MTTRAVQFLKRHKANFELVKYQHGEKGAAFAANAIGFPLEKTVKTLVVEVNTTGYTLALMPGHLELSMKKLAAVYRAKRAAMVELKQAERLTGYKVGGISPFGTQKKMPVVMEIGLLQHETVAINGGQRGLMVIMDPADIQSLTGSTTAAIAHQYIRS